MGYKDPGKLWSEVRAAERARDNRLQHRRERLARIAGPFAGTRESAEWEPENRLFEFIAYTLPRTTFSNPRVRIRSRRSGMSDEIAKAMQSSGNRWNADCQTRRPLRSNCMDYLTDWAVGVVTPKPVAGQSLSGNPIWWPQLYSLDISTWFMDPLALRLDQAKFCGHVYLRNKELLVEEAREKDSEWNLEAVQELTPEAGVDAVHPVRGDVPARGEVAIREVWCPEPAEDQDEGPEDGYNGTLYTLGCSVTSNGDEAYELRPPRPFYGPRWGPYGHCAFMHLKGVPYGVSPTIPAEGQLRELAATSRSMLDNARAYKQMVTIPASDPSALAAIQQGNQWVVPLTGDPAKVGQIAVGGVTQQQLLHYEIKTNTLDRVLGMADQQRGIVTGEGSATEVATAQQGSDMRVGDLVQVFHDYVADMQRTAAWYMFHDDRFEIRIDDQPIPGFISPVFQGSHDPKGMKFDDLELEIEPYSMEHESAAVRQMRTQRTIEIVGWLASMVPQAPWMPWQKIIPEITEDSGLEESLSEIDIAAAVEWASAMAQFQGEAQPKVGATSGRQSQGKPAINISISGKKRTGGTKSQFALLPGGQSKSNGSSSSRPSGGMGLSRSKMASSY